MKTFMLHQPKYHFRQMGPITYETFEGFVAVGTVDAKDPLVAIQQLKEWGWVAPVVEEYKNVDVAQT